MSKKGENTHKNIEERRKSILNIINDLENENSKQDNYYSISGQNIDKKFGVDNSFFLNNSSLSSGHFKYDQNSKKSNESKNKDIISNDTKTSNNNNKRKTKKVSIQNDNMIETNTLGDLIPKTNNLNNNPNYKYRNKKSIKKIRTIDSISQKEEEDSQLTLRQRLTQFFEQNDRLFYIKIIVNFLATLSSIFYFVCTYKQNLFKILNYIDFFICSLVILEHIINFLLAHHIFLYLISLESLLNFFIEIPPFFTSMCKNFHTDILYRFINITRVTRLTKSYIVMDIIQSREKSVKNQILNIIFTLLLIIFLFAGVIQMLDFENIEENLKIEFRVEERTNLLLRRYFHHYLYFIIVSLTTVGYGEITPMSILSQAMIIALVLVILLVVPDQTNELINLSNSQTIYERKDYISNEDIPFVVLIGNIGLDSLKSFCEEYFHKDHGKFYRHIVILVNKYPEKQIESFLNEREYNKFIIYLQGDPMKNYDLLRADILKAKACIIFSNKNTRDPFSEDQRALLLAIFVKKFYYLTSIENFTSEMNKEIDIDEISEINTKTMLKNNNFKIFLQLNKSESYQYYYSTLQNIYRKNMIKDQLLVIESLKMNLLSKSCLTPGIISLLSNLIISSSTGIMLSKNEPEWLREYSEGTQYEIYRFIGEGQLLNLTYQQLAIELYNKFHSILIALEINFRGSSLIKLNPQNNDTINNIIDKGLLLKSKKMKNKDNGKLYSISSDEESNNKSNIEEPENKTEQYLKIIKLKKQIKVYFYLISRDKEVIDEIGKMNFFKNNDILKSKARKSYLKLSLLNSLNINNEDKNLVSSTRNINNSSEHKKNIQKKLSKKSTHYEEEKVYSDLSSISDEEIETKAILSEIVNNNTNKLHEYKNLINNYYTLENFEKNYLNTNEIMRQGIKDRNDIKHHVIICGMHPEILHFILPLRAKYLTENMLKWIVILAPFLPQEIYDTLIIFPKIIFIQGDPLHPENLFRANITTADIAVILSGNLSKIPKNIEINNLSGNKTNNIDENNDNFHNKNNKLDEEILDSTTLFIYKAIRKINHSIKIITELLVSKNIEFLLPAKYLNKLYDQRKKLYNNKAQQTHSLKENDISSEYEMTPVFASGEIYMPSLVDKIIAQMYYNSSLLMILKLLLEGEKHNIKKKEKKLNNFFNLIGSNLFMIPCEIKSESFGEMFKRMLTKNGILCIALYRKNVIDNFYYVYTNPRKTTLIRETDFVFVLSGTENIEILNDKNIFNISFRKEDEGITNDLNADENNEYVKPSIFQILQDSIQKQFKNAKENKAKDNNNTNKNEENDSINFINNNDSEERDMSKINIRINEIKKTLKFNEYKEYDNIEEKKNYTEVEELQNKVNKSMERLKVASHLVEDFEKEIKSYIEEEIHNEFYVYLNKTKH